MSIPTSPKYVVIPADKIEQAYAPDKPRRALLATFVRLLSLAWESKYERTPRMNEEELMAFLKLSRRQYFEQKADMELLQWLRSSHPVVGFVQFIFNHVIAEGVSRDAENRTGSAENRTRSSLIGGGGESDLKLNTDSPPIPKEQANAENRTFPSVVKILSHTDMLFDGSVVVSKGLEHCIPQEVLAWCAYAYYQFNRQRLERPAGLVRRRLLDGESASEKMRAGWSEILPNAFLEVVGLITYECDVCEATFGALVEFEAHQATHPRVYICPACSKRFAEQIDLDSHIDQQHTEQPVSIETDESALVPIEGRMSAAQAWESVLDQLQQDMPRQSFETWVCDSKAVRFDGNTLTVAVHNAYAQDWLESRIRSTVEQLLVGILARRVRVMFVVAHAQRAEVDHD